MGVVALLRFMPVLKPLPAGFNAQPEKRLRRHTPTAGQSPVATEKSDSPDCPLEEAHRIGGSSTFDQQPDGKLG